MSGIHWSDPSEEPLKLYKIQTPSYGPQSSKITGPTYLSSLNSTYKPKRISHCKQTNDWLFQEHPVALLSCYPFQVLPSHLCLTQTYLLKANCQSSQLHLIDKLSFLWNSSLLLTFSYDILLYLFIIIIFGVFLIKLQNKEGLPLTDLHSTSCSSQEMFIKLDEMVTKFILERKKNLKTA